VMLSSGLMEEYGDIGRGGRDDVSGSGCGLGRVGKGFDGGDGLAGEVDEVRGLKAEEEADVGTIDWLVAGAVVGEAIAQSNALEGVRRAAQESSEEEGGT
jgi:hypothetical protein